MKYLGVARKRGSALELPEGAAEADAYEVLAADGKMVLVPMPWEPADDEQVRQMAQELIERHRKILESLA